MVFCWSVLQVEEEVVYIDVHIHADELQQEAIDYQYVPAKAIIFIVLCRTCMVHSSLIANLINHMMCLLIDW